MKVAKLPPLVLALALQVMPFSRAFVALTPAGGSSFAIVSTWIAGALALLGSVDAVSGASTVITSPKTATATNGVPFSYRITTGPEVANTFAATPLPPALTVSTTSGRITGTPTVDGVFVIHLTASDSGRADRTVRADLTLTILPPGGGGVPTAPSITTQPQSKTVTNGGSTSFTVVASGTAPLAYGWRFNGNQVAGATTSTLTLNGITTNQAGNYSVVVTNSAGSVTSSVATLTVLVRPSITSQPVSQSVAAGANVSFSVAASGTQPLSHQWKHNNANVTGGTTPTLALTAVTTNLAGSYTCVVTNSGGSATSAVATLTVLVPPTIATQPASQTVAAGANVSFNVVASGTAPLSYQWQFNGVNVSGATSATFALTGVTTNQVGSYSCVVSNGAGAVTSSAATLTVRVPPAITSQPVSQTVTVGANVDFSVVASGTAPLSYQWRRNGVNVAGATSATLALTAVTTNQAGSYTCVVTNSAGSATSSAATLTINLAPVSPTITTQPVSQTVTAGTNVSFNVVASGTAPLSYQWQFNGVNVSGATSATFALTGVTTNQVGSYSCVVSNGAGAVTSSAATLTVRVPPAITSQPVSQTVAVGDSVDFSVTASGTAPLSYQWRRNGVSVTGATSGTLSLTAVTTNQAGSYSCVVTNSAGSATSSAATLTVNLAPVSPTITMQPVNQTVTVGANVSFNVVASGSAPLSYQWQLDGVDVAGATDTTLALTAVTTNQAGNYRCVVTNNLGSATSSAATLTVNPAPVAPSIVTQPQSQSVTVGANMSFTVEANGTAPLSYQWRRNGVDVTGATSGTLSLAGVTTNQAGSYTCVVTNRGGSATSSAATLTVLVPPNIAVQPASQTVTVGANVSLSVVANGTAPLSYQWLWDGVSVAGATSSTLRLTGVSTNQAGNYVCVVSNNAGSATSSAATLTVHQAAVAPTITTQPQSQTVTTGANVSLSVEVNGTTPLSYQWRRSGVNISGAASSTLSMTSVTTNQAGNYTCVVTNSAGSVTSSAATLTVLLPPAIMTQPASQSVTAGANVSFSVVATGTMPLNYRWLFNGVDIVGASSATLSLTGVTTNQAGSYTCVVTNGVGSATSSAATLIVNSESVSPSAFTVVTNGDGAIFGIPAPQNVVEGRVYTLTAVGGEGQMFAGWTGSTNSLLPTLVVKARANLLLRANFVPLNLTTNGSGTITPNLKKTRNLILGRTYTIRAAGGSGQMFVGWSGSTNTSSPSLAFVMTSNLNLQANFVPVKVTVNGTGTLSPDLRKTINPIPGRTYAVRALPGVGQEFAGWSGSLESSLPMLRVVLTTNLDLQADFIPSPYIPIAGTYRGLFYEETEVRRHTSGYFTVTVSSRGTYSGWLQTAMSRHGFAGKLGLDCRATNRIARPYNSPLDLTLSFGSSSETDLASGQVGDTNWTATVLGDRLVFNLRTNPAPFEGNYTLVLPGQRGSDVLPAGDGFGTLRVAASGLSTFIGTMGDGARVIQSSGISKNGRWPLHSVLAYGSARGAAIGWVNLADRPEDDLNGMLIWTKPPNLLDRFYQLGFNTECQVVGSIYRTPVGPQTNCVLNLSQAEVTFDGGNVASGFTNLILFGPYSRVSNLSGNPLTLTFSTSLGTYSGTVTDPTTLKSFAFRGAVLQKPNAGFGFLTGTNQTSWVRVRSSSN